MTFARLMFVMCLLVFCISAALAQEETQPENHTEVMVAFDWRLMQGRAEAFLAAYESWLNETCGLSPAQRETVEAASKTAMMRFKDRFIATLKQYHLASSDYLSTPILFGGLDHTARSLFDQEFNTQLQGVLTPAQKEILQKQSTLRQQQHHLACAGFLVEVVDDRLFLTSTQRRVFQKKLSEVDSHFQNAFFTFNMHPDALQSKFILEEKWFPHELLTKGQRERAEVLSKGFMGDWQEVDANCTGQEYQDLIDAKAHQARPAFESYLAVQIDGYRERLDQESLKKLELANLGVIERNLADWRRGQLNQMFFEHDGSFVQTHFYVQSPTPIWMEHDGVWLACLKTGKIKSAIQAGAAEQSENVRPYILMLFDQELWLTSKQLAEFRTEVEHQMELMDIGSYPKGHLQDIHHVLRDFGRLLHGMPDERMAQILSERQYQVWMLLKKELVVKENTIQSVMRHGTNHLGSVWQLPYVRNE